MTAEEREKWQKTRAKGKWRFILINGILLWALPVGISVIVFIRIYDYFFDQNSYQNWSDNWTYKITFYSVCYLILGCLFGWWMWNKSEKDFFENK